MAVESGASDGQRVLAAGVLVTVAGEERRLLFDFRALRVLEDEFGGIYDFTQALNGGWQGKRLKALRIGLLAGGAWSDMRPGEEAARADAIDAQLDRLLGSPDFIDQVNEAITAIGQAFDQAMPMTRRPASSKVSARGKSSRGAASTEGPSSKQTSRSASSQG